MHRTRHRLAIVLLTGLSAGACVGEVGEQGGGSGETTPGAQPDGTKDRNPPGGLIDTKPPEGAKGGTAACKPGIAPTPRLVRLTRLQYANAVRDLTGLTGDIAAGLPHDPALVGFNRGNDLEVSDLVMQVYSRQAESIARQVVAKADGLAQVVGCRTKDAACAKTFVEGFGLRTFRRPLTKEEVAKYVALFDRGATLGDGADAFTSGVQLVIEAMLQSPRFIYRAETSTKPQGGVIPLGNYEIAQKLSFTLANTTPDAALLAAAAAGELVDPAKVATHARRLLMTANGKALLRDFAVQWMETEEWGDRLDKVEYKAMTKALLPTLEEEIGLFIEDVTFGSKKGLETLLTAPFAFVNEVTAPFYEVKGTFGKELQKVELDATKRAGLLTQVGFLAGRAYSNRSSPIHRGVTVGKNFLCLAIPDPVPNVAPLPPSSAGKTMRQIVTEHTGAVGCRECHYNFINPLGFGLENYDEAGKWRTTDTGQPVDASGTLVGTAKNLPFNNAVELAQAVVKSPEATACYARKWWQYSFGRAETEADACALSVLAGSLGNDSYTTIDLLVDMTRTQAFMFRTAEAQ